jgi:hypothetical protein
MTVTPCGRSSTSRCPNNPKHPVISTFIISLS